MGMPMGGCVPMGVPMGGGVCLWVGVCPILVKILNT